MGTCRPYLDPGVPVIPFAAPFREKAHHTAVIVAKVPRVAEEAWHEARLIPTSGINGAQEQERRATSAVLAVMSAVREFGRALTQPLGAPAGPVASYIEIPFELGNARCYPDGLIRVARGKRSWTALVEVKTSTNALEVQQLENYLDIAREQGFDALLTISNQVPAVAGQHPVKVDKRKLKKVALHHYSWTQVLSEAVMQKEHRGVADPDQAWILGELIRYLEHPRSGALEFDDMGASWVSVREAVSTGTLRATDASASEVAGRSDALLRYASLRLGRRLGTEVTPVLPRRDLGDPAGRTAALAASLASTGTLTGAVRIPNAVAPLHVTTDLRAGQVTCHVDVDAPKQGRPATRVNWLVRQLRQAPDSVRVEAFAAYSRGDAPAGLLGALRTDPAGLIGDGKQELRTFRVALSRNLGSKRGRGRGSYIDSVLDAVDEFYAEVLQHLKAWTAAPPRMREPVEKPPVSPASLASTAQSSQDGAEPTTPDTETPAPAPQLP